MNWPKGIRYRNRMPFFTKLYVKQKSAGGPIPTDASPHTKQPGEGAALAKKP